MKVTIKQDNFKKALNSVGRIAIAKAGMPILAGVLLRADEGKLTVAATNLDVTIVTSTRAKIIERGTVVVPAKLLTDFIANLPHTNVEISSKDNKVKIVAGSFQSTINSLSAEDYPALPEPATEKSFTIDSNQLRRALSGTALVTSSDMTRPILTGVYFHSNNGKAYMAATDGYRLAEDFVFDTDQDISAIIPGNTANDLTRQLVPDEKVVVKYDDEQITFEMGETSVTSGLVDGKFLDYRQLIPNETNFTITVNKSDFMQIVKVAELFSRNSAGSIIVEGDPQSKTLSVRSITTEIGENNSSIEADIVAENDEQCIITLNSKFLIDALGCINSDKVIIKFNNKLSPLLLTGETGNYSHIIMPVKS